MYRSIITAAALTIFSNAARADSDYIAMTCGSKQVMDNIARAGMPPNCGALAAFDSLEACERYIAKFHTPLHCFERDVPSLRQAD